MQCKDMYGVMANCRMWGWPSNPWQNHQQNATNQDVRCDQHSVCQEHEHEQALSSGRGHAECMQQM